jgi:hypothetical protein
MHQDLFRAHVIDVPHTCLGEAKASVRTARLVARLKEQVRFFQGSTSCATKLEEAAKEVHWNVSPAA